MSKLIQQWRKLATAVLKCSAAIAILAYLVMGDHLSFSILAAGFSHWDLVVAGAGLVALNLIGTAVRFWWLVRAVGLQCPLGRALRLCFIGLFFNIFLLGGAGGDVVRTMMLGRTVQSKALAAASVLADRGCGLAGLVVITALATMTYPELIMTQPAIRVVALGALTALVAMTSFIASGALFVRNRISQSIIASTICWIISLAISGWWHHYDQSSFAPLSSVLLASGTWLGSGLAYVICRGEEPDRSSSSSIQRFKFGLHQYLRCPNSLAVAVISSAIIQIPLILALPLFTHSMELSYPGLSAIAIAGPLALLANILPLPAGGLGGGEAAYALSLGSISGLDGAAQASVFMMLRMWLVLFGALSGLLLLTPQRMEDCGETSDDLASVKGAP